MKDKKKASKAKLTTTTKRNRKKVLSILWFCLREIALRLPKNPKNGFVLVLCVFTNHITGQCGITVYVRYFTSFRFSSLILLTDKQKDLADTILAWPTDSTVICVCVGARLLYNAANIFRLPKRAQLDIFSMPGREQTALQMASPHSRRTAHIYTKTCMIKCSKTGQFRKWKPFLLQIKILYTSGVFVVCVFGCCCSSLSDCSQSSSCASSQFRVMWFVVRIYLLLAVATATKQ